MTCHLHMGKGVNVVIFGASCEGPHKNHLSHDGGADYSHLDIRHITDNKNIIKAIRTRRIMTKKKTLALTCMQANNIPCSKSGSELGTEV